ncbi:hypothetical protein P4200_12840 [Pseudomonas aeruginosa]|jgi:hypothetical protein|nr:hypothetical protein [Pseudomonas aeruginosa]
MLRQWASTDETEAVSTQKRPRRTAPQRLCVRSEYDLPMLIQQHVVSGIIPAQHRIEVFAENLQA